MSIVVDASVALSWLLPGEGMPVSLSLRDGVIENPAIRLLVPPNFWYEVANTLWVAVRRKRISGDVAMKALDSLVEFKFTVWEVEPTAALALSLQQNLTVYDSAYLALALEQNSVLWTLDKGLSGAAKGLNISVEPAYK